MAENVKAGYSVCLHMPENKLHFLATVTSLLLLQHKETLLQEKNLCIQMAEGRYSFESELIFGDHSIIYKHINSKQVSASYAI